ncbi:MAG: prephenate dehydratase [Suipraeoptans sp.]
MRAIPELREELDNIDKEIVRLINRRMDACKEVGLNKAASGKKVYDEEREREKLKQVMSYVDDNALKKNVEELFIQIMTQSRREQYKIINEKRNIHQNEFSMVDDFDFVDKKVVFQGVEGSYSEAATNKYFPNNDRYHVKTFRSAIEEVMKGNADFGVLPIENSSAGAVSDVYDLLSEYPAAIIGEIIIPIVHTLSGVPGTTISTIEKIYSHQQALMQSSDYLETHPDWELINVANTAVAARKVKEDASINKAAVCSREAAKLYGLNIIENSINHSESNKTKFIIISHNKIYKKNAKKVSVSFELPHKTGSLYRILSHVIFNELNMTKIESRPIRDKTWEYRFFVDFEGSLNSAEVYNALVGLKEESKNLRVLGNY